jgi:hypothetical protein
MKDSNRNPDDPSHPAGPHAHEPRPAGLTALTVFFLAGTLISFTAAISLLSPGGPLEPMWRINPRAHGEFATMGSWAIVLLAAVCVACGLSAGGLWRGTRWGYRLAVGILAANLLGDAANALLRKDLRALIGLPIAGGMIAYLTSRRIKRFFGSHP